MAQYSLGFHPPVKQDPTAAPLWEIQSSPTDYTRIIEVGGVFYSANIGPFALGLGKPATPGVLRAPSAYSFAGHDSSSPPCGTVIGFDWITLPAAPTIFFRRLSITIGGNLSTNEHPRFLLPLGAGLSMPPSTSMVLWLLTAGAVSQATPLISDCWVEIDT